MAINFPTSIDSFTNPTSGQTQNSPSHATQHANANDAIAAIEAKVGVNSSAVNTTHDYKLSGVATGDKAVSKTGTETLTNKTLTSPAVNLGSDATGDMYYRNSGGALTRLPIGTSGQIINVDVTGIPAYVANPAAADASTTVKGVVEEATQAEFDAGTAAGGTSARLFVNPSTVRAKLINTGVLDTGSANAVAIAPSPAITAYATYQEFTFKAAATNTGATTVNVNALGTKNIYKNGSALVGGEIVTGQMYRIAYDGTQFNLLNNSLITVDQDSTPNTLSTLGSYYTTVMPILAALGWTITGTGTATHSNGVSIGNSSANATCYATLLGRTNTAQDATLLFNSGIDLKVAYWMTIQLISSGTTPFGAADSWGWSGFCNPSTSVNTFANITDNGARVGFAHYNGRIYAVTGSGSAVTTTDIQADAGNTKRHFMIDFNQTSCKFYINGALVATHTTNIPSTGDGCAIEFGASDFNSNTNYIAVSNVTLSQSLT